MELRSCGGEVIAIPEAIASEGAGLVVTDVDSTLIGQEVIEEIAHYAGTREEVARITERAMNGELDFAQSLRERVATLAGVPEQVFAEVSRSITVTVGAQHLIDAVHTGGGFFGIVSGGFEEVVGPLAASLGIDHYCANRLEVSEGILTGRVLGDIVTADTKVEMLRTWADAHQVPMKRTVAIGDGANDIPMMHEAALGVAFCAKPAVREQVGAQLSVSRLDVLSVLTAPLENVPPTSRA
ncbi:phosphoserine phosphatase SerB [Schaalia sp. Marseille-Q2122]|uniref:phosphoserine phosphatase SerB n=1 Tax=Schaalia sp. Marseille-Q2122 TaxID=2736604 RepID=UPI00158A3C5D|nr:phosphoserine phosphatase SerB [Schaalia sp. Marseille-Q2122]